MLSPEVAVRGLNRDAVKVNVKVKHALETAWDFEDIVKLKGQVKLCNKSRRKIEENGLIDTKKTD